MNNILLQIWKYRTFILYSIKSEFKSRFVRSKLGFMWMIIYPLSQVLVYALVLSNILSAKLPGVNNKYAYAIYLLAGTLSWSLFSEVLSRSVNIFVDNANLIKKLSFPKIVLPVIIIGVALINSLILFLCSIVIFILLGFMPGMNIFWLPVLFFVNIVFSISIGLLLGVLNVFIRDVSQVLPIILQFWFWFTPVVYMRSIIPAKYTIFLNLNPMYPLVCSFQNVILLNTSPMFVSLSVLFLLSMLVLLFGLFIYNKASVEMVDVL